MFQIYLYRQVESDLYFSQTYNEIFVAILTS